MLGKDKNRLSKEVASCAQVATNHRVQCLWVQHGVLHPSAPPPAALGEGDPRAEDCDSHNEDASNFAKQVKAVRNSKGAANRGVQLLDREA